MIYRRIIGWITLFFCAALYIICSSDQLTDRIYGIKSGSPGPLGSDKYLYGDLFGMSYLSDFKQRTDWNGSIQLDSCKFNKEINLYAMVDSYIWTYLPSASYYCGVNDFQFARSNDQQKLTTVLDSGKVNVLLLESAERNFRTLIRDRTLQSFFSIKKDAPPVVHVDQPSFIEKIFGTISKKNTDRHFESVVWESRIFTPVKSLKADINYRLFNRIDEKVSVSTACDRLFYIYSTDTTKSESSYVKISDGEIDSIINELNQAYLSYKKMGFDEVYLSIIPNSVVLYDINYKNQTYNNLIDRVQSSRNLKMPYVDALAAFKATDANLYFKTDTHWNRDGAYTWLNLINQRLRAQVELRKNNRVKE